MWEDNLRQSRCTLVIVFLGQEYFLCLSAVDILPDRQVTNNVLQPNELVHFAREEEN
jgi:hypothetical protein